MAKAKKITVTQQFLRSLSARGIKYVFANAGTDFAPIIEGLVRSSQQGLEAPTFITVPHENVAISMAQGYYRISGEPAGVMVHVTVGTANTVCGLMNASRDNCPVLMMAGRTPITETGNIGSRNVGIHWGQENFDQGGMVREFVKWDYELRTGQPVDTVVGRALDIAMAEPKGPVYLTLPREVLGEEVEMQTNGIRQRPLGSQPAVANLDTLEQAADLIAKAEHPLIVTGKLGARPGAFETLSKLANDFGLPVVQGGEPSLKSSDPMNMGFAIANYLPKADLVLVVENQVPWIPRVLSPRADAKLIHISPDPHYANLPFRGFEMDLAVAGEPVETLRLLSEVLATRSKGRKRRMQTRRKALAERHNKETVERQSALAEAANIQPILPPWVAHCINKVKSDDTILVNELGVNVGHLDHTDPNGFVNGGMAGGLGFGLGSALGAKMAAPERDVILMVGDGSYIFGNPTAAHYVGRAEELPTLTMVMNNHMWFAVRRSTMGMYPNGQAVKANRMPLTELAPSPDFEKTIEACGGYGERVEDPADLEAAMRRALDKTRSGTSALLNVITQPGGRD